jgi:hypothetical protein
MKVEVKEMKKQHKVKGARYVMVEGDRKGHEEGLVLTRVTWEKTGSATHLTDKHLRLPI